MSENFVHLHLHSQYSLLDGAIKFEELVERAKEFGMEAVALTDHGNLYGAYDFFDKAKKAGIKPIIGCELYVTPTLKLEKPSDGKNFHLTVLCMNEKGYSNLSNLVSKGYLEGFYRRPRVDHELLQKHNEGLIVLSGCMSSELSRELFSKDRKKAISVASLYREIFGDRYYLEVQATGLPEQNFVNKEVKKISKELGIPLIATNDCHFLKQEDARPHDALLCVQTGSNLNDEKRMRFAGDQFFLKSKEQMEATLSGFQDAIDGTVELSRRCSFEFKEEEEYKFPEFEIPDGTTLEEYIKKMSREKLDGIFAESSFSEEQTKLYKDRLEYELTIICQMGFPAYFLVVADFINYAKTNGIPVGPGRGSAAGSLVAFALGITDVDPIPYNLIFERFLNPGRVSMPDIDVDFCTEGRDKVIEYVTERYGKDKVAQIGTFGTMSSKAVIKDVGRVLGIPYGEVDKLSKMIPSYRGKVFSIQEALDKVPQISEMVEESEQLQELIELAKPLENMVRHASTHAAGVVISNEPISDYIPLYKGSRDETVTQFDMNCIEKLGYVKFDFLGLKTLTVINKAVAYLKANNISDKEFNIKKIPLDDPEVYKLLGTSNTRGVFQIESTGMKQLLSRLHATTFDDIIAVLALYRPGPLDSGMVDEFVKCKNGKKKVHFPHPSLKEILKDTYGLFVYQEQIMQTASEIANYTLGEADLLRRAMGKKKPAEMKAQRERFLTGANDNGIPKKKATELFDTMEKFAEYSFNKSHSTAYALITYQTAYLKTHYPAEFMSALMTIESHNTDKIISSITECNKMNIEVLAPDVNESISGFTPVDGKIRFGLSAIKNVGDSTVKAIIDTRNEEGPFESIFDFCTRVDSSKLNRRTFESLVKSGAFTSLEPSRAKLMKSLENLISYTALKQKSSPDGQHSLFDIDATIPPPKLEATEEWDEKVMLQNEMDVLGFYVTSHPMLNYSSELEMYSSNCDSEKILEIKNKKKIKMAGVVRSLEIKHTKNGKNIYGNMVLEDLKGSVDVIIFNDTLRKSMDILEDRVEPIIVEGFIDPTEERAKIRAQEIYSLGQLRINSSVHISLDEVNSTPDNMNKLKEIFNEYPGPSKIILHIRSNGEIADVEVGNCTVDLGDKFIKSVEKLLGENVVVLS